MVWEGGEELMKEYQELGSSIIVMNGETICSQFDIRYDYSNQAAILTGLCQALSAIHSEDIYLIVDEMPARGDFSKVQRLNVTLAVALQPASLSYDLKPPILDPPVDMNSIELKRVFRYTHSNLNFLVRVLRHWKQRQEERQELVHWRNVMQRKIRLNLEYPYPVNSSPIPSSLREEEEGHEIQGYLPECLLLPFCYCISDTPVNECDDLEQHLMKDNWNIILARINRLKQETLQNETDVITIIVDEENRGEEGCCRWLATRNWSKSK